MSAFPALAVTSAAPPSSVSMPGAWALALGFGPFSPDDGGHHVVTNGPGHVIVSGAFMPLLPLDTR